MGKQGRRRRLARLGVLGLVFFSLWGCAGGKKQMMAVPDAGSFQYQEKPEVRSEGSLWKESGQLSSLFTDERARKVGDLITVNIVETASASNKANTNTSRSSSLSAGIDGFFNAEKRFPADKPFFNPFSRVAGSLESSFDGKGATTRSGNLNAFMTARVMQVLPNGNLRIAGTREVTVNKETQVIILAGTVRPRDVSSENIILSTFIADARISYSGVGVVDDRQEPGWMMRVMDAIWPF